VTTIAVKTVAGAEKGSVDLADAVFGIQPNVPVLHQVVTAQLAKRRAGTQSTKTRAEVRGGGTKPYRQKGTGNARQGSMRSHHHVGGGRAFGPHPRDYDYALPKKVRKGALRSALSLRAKEQKVIVLDAFAVEMPQLTKKVIATLTALGAKSALVVDAAANETLVRGARNLTKTKWLAPEGLNVYDVLKYDTLVITAPSAKLVEEALAVTTKASKAADVDKEEP
jgi:large subunit ribosomal protein L4